MVAQAVDSPLSSGQWENLTSPMPAIGNTDKPLCLVKRTFKDIVDDTDEGHIKPTLQSPKKGSLGYRPNGRRQDVIVRNGMPRGEGFHAVTKQVFPKPHVPKNRNEKPREEVIREEREKNQLESGHMFKYHSLVGEASRPLYKKSRDLELAGNQEATVSPKVLVKSRNEKFNNEVQENSDKEKEVLLESRHDGPSVIPSSQNELDNQEEENASEGATTLLLLADGSQRYISSPERAEVYPQFISGSEPNQEIGNHDPEGSRVLLNEPTSNEHFTEDDQNSSGEEKEEFSGDEDDQDGVLIVDLADSSADVHPVYEDQEEDEPDTVNSSDGSDTRDDRGSKQVNNGQYRNNNRVESKKKMEDGKAWLQNFMVLAGSFSIVKLSDIEKSYLACCQKNGKEPLATPVLARLIHTLFPSAEKCRLGARGNQRIHYRNLRFKADDQNVNQTSKFQNVTEVHPQKSVKQAEVIKSKQPNASENQNAQIESVIEECTDDLHENNLPIDNGKSLKNQTQTEESPEKKQNQAIQSQDDEESCKAAAKKLSDVLKWISGQGENHKKALLRDFAHSASCQDVRCLPVCMMFRRVRRHVVAAKHCCSVLRLYSMLLRNHVSSCTSDKCGLPACPALQKTRIQKRSLEMEGIPAKRVAVSHGHGFPTSCSIALAPRSPEGSLPGSPVNSPPLSPDVLMSGQVQYVLLPVRMSVLENQVV